MNMTYDHIHRYEYIVYIYSVYMELSQTVNLTDLIR